MGGVGSVPPMAPRPDHPFLQACRGKPAEHVPVWFMRQAGRSLPEYNRVKGELSILDAVERPELAAELTLQPVRRYGQIIGAATRAIAPGEHVHVHNVKTKRW